MRHSRGHGQVGGKSFRRLRQIRAFSGPRQVCGKGLGGYNSDELFKGAWAGRW
jgi:hypothetical protein